MNLQKFPIWLQKTYPILLIVLGFLLGVIFTKLTNKPTNTIVYKDRPVVNQKQDNTANNQNTNKPTNATKTYTSQKLGVSFNYIEYVYKDPVLVKEIDNKIYVYLDPAKPTEGSYVEVFTKDPASSLINTIKTSILKGYTEDKCLVAPYKGSNVTNASMEYARIDAVNILPNDSREAALKKISQCPEPYTHSYAGEIYFLMDKNMPSKYAFVFFGQSGVPSGTGSSGWDKTISFIN